jgi:hypothetical protein
MTWKDGGTPALIMARRKLKRDRAPITLIVAETDRTKRVGKNIGIRVPHDKFYIYFAVKNEIYRVSKSIMVKHGKIRDKAIRNKIRIFNAKLREKVAEIPLEIYDPKRIYCVKKDGNVADYGELVGIFPNPHCTRLFADDVDIPTE